MNNGRKNRTAGIAVAGGILVVAILVLGTVWTGRNASLDSEKAVRAVSLLYLDELAGRREQVVEDDLKDNIERMRIAIGMLTDEDLASPESLQGYQRKMKQLFNLEKFAFVDDGGTIYTSLGTEPDAGAYGVDQTAIAGPEISLHNAQDGAMKVIIAVPVDDIPFNGGRLVACFMQIDMQVMLSGISMTSQDTEATYCNIYTSQGLPLSRQVLAGAADEENLLDALGTAQFDEGYTLDQVEADFREGRRGVVSFSYHGVRETLAYVPVEGTDWLLTYLIRESVISQQISSISGRIVQRSLILSALTALILGGVFTYLVIRMRKSARLALERETAEAANRVKHEEMEHRLALQEELLAQKAQQEQQEKLITALASDYRSVYYLELDKDLGVCYQARADLHGLQVGQRFPYLKSVTEYCEKYVTEPYREAFMRFIQPDAIREGLRDSLVISFRYIIRVNGKESYETVKFAGVRHPEDRDDHVVHTVGACFTDVDAETRAALRQQEELGEALTAAEQASRAKTAFLSNMSHEIRTPMNAIIGLNNIALNEDGLSDKLRVYLEKIGFSAQHLLGIINDILDMSRIESGRMVIRNEEFSFAANLEQVNTIISGQCAEKGLHYECRTVGRIDDYYYGDELKLRQVMINILGNAVKFTPEGGTVTFLIEEGQRYGGKATLKLVFRDTGVGMSKEYLPHVFDAFSQEETVSTGKYGSTGLGMPITKSIVELMNGRIDVESEKGVGTTFTVTVTLGESERTGGSSTGLMIDPKDMRVLVIDDDPIALEHAQIVLGQVGIRCDLAESGAKGLEMAELNHARRADYDLILVDLKMPEMDGVETTRGIRSAVGHGTPIIILTSYSWDEVMEEAKQAGVDTFVAKPLFVGSVLDQFREAFKNKNKTIAVKAELKGRRVLLAEDMSVNAEIMTMVLSMREIDAEVAENGRIAVDMFASHEAGYYDAILMDMRMPVMDGLEATRAIRAMDRPDASSVPIIALTANAFDEDVQRSLQAGLNAHLSKPVEPDALFETLESLIAP